MKTYITLLLISFSLHAQDAANSITKIQPDNELTIQGVTLGKTKMNDVKEKFKAKEIYHQGEAADSLYVLCFKTSAGQTIAFESGEAGGVDRVVHSVSVNSAQDPYALANVCEKTALIKGKLALNGISLGMSPDIVKRLINAKNTKDSGNVIEYKYALEEKTELGRKNITSEFIITFKNSMSTKFTANKRETF